MGQYTYLVVAMNISALLLALIYLSRSRYPTKSGRSRSWVSYLFLWELILDGDASKQKGRFLTTREWFGWAVVAFIIFCGILFTGQR